MSILSYRFADTSFTPQEKSHLLTETDIQDLTFQVFYWDATSVAGTSRDIMIYAKAHYGAKYEFLSPSDENWAGNTETAFSCLPMLKKVHIAESVVIDTYLAERFELVGDNKWESVTIQSFYSNIHYLRERLITKVLCVPEELRLKNRQEFLKETLKKFLENHAFHLEESGNNGHY
ncbi:hypothetical protein BGZ65_005737, partial [Modicella reniformis]